MTDTSKTNRQARITHDEGHNSASKPSSRSEEDQQRRAVFARNLKHFREEADLSQVELAGMARLGLSTISRAENARNMPNVSGIARIAEALGRPVQDFLMKDPPPMPDARRGPVRFRFIGPLDPDLAAQAIQEIERVNIEHHRRVQAAKLKSRQGKKL